MAEDLRITIALNDERHTETVPGVVNGAYFQHDYFQNDYFQAGVLQVSGNTDSVAVNLNNDRYTCRLD